MGSHLDHRLVFVHRVQADLVPAHRGLAVGQLDPVEGDGVLAVPDGSGRGVVVVLVSLSSRLMVGHPSTSSSCSTTDNPL